MIAHIWSLSFYFILFINSISFIPVAYALTSYQRKYGCQTVQYVPNVFVVEIKVECGDLGEIYEDGQHHVSNTIITFSPY